MIGVSGIGSVVDVATLVLVTGEILRHYRVDRRAYAGIVALAEHVDPVTEDRLQAELDVDDRDVEAYERG
jgi:hypothetical protein